MEKPAAYDYIRIRERSTVDRDTAVAMHDRMMLRGSLTRSDSEEADEHTWRGDHAFSADAAAYSLSNFIEPEVKKKHPDWTSERVHEEAMNQFEKRLQQDLSYEKREAIHEETTVRWEIRETSPGVKELSTRYGDDYITLRELWEHTREFAEAAHYPDGYNAEEAKAQLAMQDAFINGEVNGFVSILSHPDSIRYVQVWEPSENGDIVSKQIDLYSITGRDFSAEESVQLIEHVATYQGSSAPTIHRSEESTYAHFFVTSGAHIREEDIRTIAVAESFVRERIQESSPLYQQESRTQSLPQTVTRDVIGGTRDMVATFGAYLEKKIHSLTTPASTEQSAAVTIRSVLHKKGETATNQTAVPILEKQPALPLTNNPDNTDFFVENILMLNVLDNARRLPVGPIAFLALATLQHERPLGPVKNSEPKEQELPPKTVEPSTEHNEHESHISGEIKRFWDTVMLFMQNLDAKVIPEKRKVLNDRKNVGTIHTEKPDAMGKVSPENTFMNMLSLLSIFFRSEEPSETPRFAKDRSIRIRKSIVSDSYVSSLHPQERHDAFAAMTKRLEQGTMMPGTLQKTTELLSFSDVERGLGKLIFAYVLWMEVRNEAVEETHQPDHRNVPGSRHAESQGAEGEVIFPWILLAIIRQLSMIREMGKSRYAGSTKKQGNTKSKPKIPADDRFPDHGIIFSAVLHDRMKYIAAAQADTRLFIYG